MTTKNTKIDVAFKKNTTLASETLEAREDLYLSKLAEKLDKLDAKTHKHKDVWK